MRIYLLILNNYYPDIRVHKEAKSLVAAGHQVTILALWQEGFEKTEEISGYQVARLPLCSRGWRNRLFSPMFKYIEFAIKVRQYARKEPADVYQANDAITLPAAWLASRQTGARLV